MMRTIPHFFEQTVKRFPQHNYFLDHDGVEYVGTSYQEAHQQVLNMAAALLSIGIGRDDKLSIISEGRKEWVIGELGMYYVRAVNVPLSIKLVEDDDLVFRLNHAEVKVVLVSPVQLERLRRIKNQLQTLQYIVLFDDGAKQELQENEIGFQNFISKGEAYRAINNELVSKLYEFCEDNDVANICYTSGTTAHPKGILLSQRNYTANVEQALSVIPEVDENYKSLFILPLDHSFAHTVGIYIMMARGASIAFVQNGATPAETLRNIPKNIQEIQPTFLLSVPALAKNFANKISEGINKKGFMAKLLFRLGLWSARHLKFLHQLIDQLLFKKVRQGFCPSLQFFIGGGALLDTDLQHFYQAIGIPMYQGYGLTEASPIISTNTPSCSKIGSSGKVLPGIELKIVAGEIVIKGENVMLGYWKNPKATAETIVDGWLYTGDMGYVDEDGFLYVMGRFKSLLIASDGEKYSPEGIEEAMMELIPWVHQVLIYNNQSTFTSGIVVPNSLRMKVFVRENNLDVTKQEDLEKVLNELWGQIESFKKQAKFPSRWLPARVLIAPEVFSESNGLVNSTLKIVRPKVIELHQDLLNDLYSTHGSLFVNSENVKNIQSYLN